MENRLLKKTIYDQDQCISVESGRLKQVQHELEAAKKDNEEFKREFTEAMDDVARLGGENEKLQKEIERLNGVIQKMWFNQIIIRYDSQFDWSTKEYWWQKFKSEHNL